MLFPLSYGIRGVTPPQMEKFNVSMRYHLLTRSVLDGFPISFLSAMVLSPHQMNKFDVDMRYPIQKGKASERLGHRFQIICWQGGRLHAILYSMD